MTDLPPLVNDSIRSVATNATNTARDDHDRLLTQHEKTVGTDTPARSEDEQRLSPSLRLLFSLLTPRQTFLVLLPAILSSMLAGGIAPFMTWVVGQVFDIFSRFAIANHPSQQDKNRLMHGIGIAAIELGALAVGALTLGSITSSLWIWTGEQNVKSVRQHVYKAVTKKDMPWFDRNVGAEASKREEDGPIGPGGMMSKFAKETDHIQKASSLASGLAIQHLTTCVTCLGLAFVHSWLLTLVILSTVPLLVIFQGLSQAISTPLLERELSTNGQAGTVVERAVSAIATVKAFNAAAYEYTSLTRVLDRLFIVDRRLNAVWGATSAVSQFILMGMFVQGFWFGGKLVREGKLTAGDVMAVFWACLIATSNLQMCLPQFILITKGKVAMASLLTLAKPSSSTAKLLKQSRSHYRGAAKSLRKIIPRESPGELSLQGVSFAYPTRPTVSVLRGINIFLPAKEMTFIVGGSGSGKSTIAQLLIRLYRPQSGLVQLDNQDTAYLDETWLRQEVACVSQDCILFDMTVHENVAIGLTGARSPADATRAQVIEACRAALMHDFVRELPDGYDTRLGTGGTLLSGGQRQRLAIARAILRNPTVLILDESTSALDATSRLLVFEAIKRVRRSMTTIVITHDLSQITSRDFVYVLQNGHVIEQGYRYDLERIHGGEFRSMMQLQRATGGFLPVKDLGPNIDWADVQREQADDDDQEDGIKAHGGTVSRRSFNNVQAFSIVANHTGPRRIRRIPHFDDLAGAFGQADKPMLRTGMEASRRRQSVEGTHKRHRAAQIAGELEYVRVDVPQTPIQELRDEQQSVLRLIREIYPTVPAKGFVFIGLIVCILSGTVTPVFSSLLSRLLFEVSIGAVHMKIINTFGGILLGVAAGDGLLMGLKYFIMETLAMNWVNFVRELCFDLILTQDKSWFDKPQNNPPRMVQILIKDGDDARVLMAEVLGQCVVVVAMLTAGLTWALVRGWQLTLVGLGIAPIFVWIISIQNKWIARCEARRRSVKDEVSKVYYEAISNIRGIRSMSLERVFQNQFDTVTRKALTIGTKGAFIEGSTYGVASAVIYVAEAVLFYVGAIMLADGTYTYRQMVEVLNLIIFTVTIGSQLMAFTEKFAKSVQASRDFNALLKLSPTSKESHGLSQPAIHGPIVFDRVSFAYPERPDVKVLHRLSMRIDDGECVAIVGSSGSGKSTIAALLQRLYEPDSGRLFIGSRRLLSTINVHYLRKHVAVVSQTPNLFDTTIAQNIAYGVGRISFDEIQKAAMISNVHEFIMSLPDEYETMVGENASLISGGQAQRLQIARALVRPSKILILDESTSALDAVNEAAILETIRATRAGRTTIMITHKLPVMRMCDRILVMQGGELKEQGTYQSLMERNGVFAQLARSGEWTK